MKNWIMLLVITLVVMTGHVRADCTYAGKSYQAFEVLTISDPAMVDMYEKGEASIDATTLALKCMPIVDLERVEKGDFGANRIPAVKDTWVPSGLIYGKQKYSSEPLWFSVIYSENLNTQDN